MATGRGEETLRVWRQAVAITSRAIGVPCVAALLGFGVCPQAAADDSGLTQAPVTPSFKPAFTYNGAAFGNLSGGLRAGSTYTSNLNLQLNVDAAALLGWRDTIAYVDGLWLQGGLPSSFVGDAQGVSSISAPNSVKLYEAWVQTNFLGNRLSVLGGLYDLNTEFYRLQSAGLFLNSSFGIGPEFAQSGASGPSIFPDTSVGMRIAFKPKEGVVVRVAVLDGVPVDRPDGSRGIFKPGDGTLLVTEVDFVGRAAPDRPSPGARSRIGRQAMLGDYDAKVALGAWYYTASFADLSATQADGQPILHRGSAGFYVLGDRLLYTDPQHTARKLTGFLQLGLGDSRVDRFGAYVGAGVTVVGLVDGRDSDEFGLGVAYARNGSHYMSAQRSQDTPATRAETAVELTYLMQVNSWLAIQPDLQFVISPNTTPGVRNALAFQLRIEVSY